MAQAHALGDLPTNPVDCRESPWIVASAFCVTAAGYTWVSAVAATAVGSGPSCHGFLRTNGSIRSTSSVGGVVSPAGRCAVMAGWGAQQRSATTVKHPVEGVMKGCSRVSKRAQSMGLWLSRHCAIALMTQGLTHTV